MQSSVARSRLITRRRQRRFFSYQTPFTCYHRLAMTRGRVLAFLVLLACALVVSCSSGSKKDPAQGKTISLDEIHPCDTNDPFGVQASQLNATPTPTPRPPTPTATTQASQPSGGSTGAQAPGNGVTGTSGMAGCDGPDFSQRCPLWGNDEYSHANGEDIGCGKTIGQ